MAFLCFGNVGGGTILSFPLKLSACFCMCERERESLW